MATNEPSNNSDMPQLSKHNKRVVQPLPKDPDGGNAVDLIRQKLSAIYNNEPSAEKELAEDAAHHGRRSKHQQFMHELSTSGKSLAEIQTAWHEYYIGLSNDEKHKVWQEFYANYDKASSQTTPIVAQPIAKSTTNTYRPKTNDKPPQAIQQSIQQTVRQRSKKEIAREHHKSSIKFGLITGFIVVAFMMFGFFNERILVPFIRPNSSLSATPLILDENAKVGPEPKLIIPKINVEAPVVYDENSIQEDAVQSALEDGVLHYATTPNPGEFGNSVIFGHSSNNILNKGDYKYIFVQLNKLEKDDTFFIHKDGVRYVYKVYEKKIVKPSEVSVLSNTSKDATMTLITCDPPGTAINRLVVIGEQISPSPDKNQESSVQPDIQAAEPEILPSNAPSLWSRFTSWLF